MYVNPTGFAELRKRVEDLYRAHEQELEEVMCSHGNLSFLVDNSLRSYFRIYNGWHYFVISKSRQIEF
jgi:hypothetical protein